MRFHDAGGRNLFLFKTYGAANDSKGKMSKVMKSLYHVFGGALFRREEGGMVDSTG